MNKTAIKNFAIWARNKLRADIILKAGLLGITDKGIVEPSKQSTSDLQIFDIGTSQPVQIKGKTAIEQRKSLVAAIRAKNLKHPEAFDAVIEEVAYTWFNRLIAVRFMEVNDYLPSRVRVLSSENPAKAEPDFVTNPFDTDLDFTPAELDLIDDLKDNNKSDELFQLLFIKQCNKLNEILPELFEKTNDYTELLLNVSFTDKDGVVWHLVHDIEEKDFNIGEDGEGQVEMIGWLYQFYNDERKNQVINIQKSIVKKADIPAATQLFTTDWVVRYIVDNSLGRYWIERNPESKLADKLEYFVLPKDGHITYVNEAISPQDVKLLDPCMGSAHFLVYAFDVLMAIYEEKGYSQRDAAISIAENNLYGLEIDKRAYQLSYFALMMKVRRFNRRVLRKDNRVRLNIAYIRPTDYDTDFVNLYSPSNQPLVKKLLEDFNYGDELGSIIQLRISDTELKEIKKETETILNSYSDNIFDTALKGLIETKFVPVLKQAEILIGKYEIIATNPPFMNKMDKNLKKYVNDYYKDYSPDMFSVFIFRNFSFCKPNGYSGFMSPYVWMFLKTYEKLRSYIITNKSLTTLVQMEYSAFEEATVPICTFVLNNCRLDKLGLYFRLTSFKGGMNVQKNKVLEAIANPECGYFYEADSNNFSKIPGAPIAYWASERIIQCFNNITLGKVAYPCQGMATTNNDRFLRHWFEVKRDRILFSGNSEDDTCIGFKWFPYNKGGSYRKWYGNNSLVINFENKGKEVCAYIDSHSNVNHKGRVINREYYFKENFTWSALTAGNFSCRYSPKGFIFDTKGSSCFCHSNLYYYMALMNSNVSSVLLKILAPTLDFNCGTIAKIPIIESTENNSFTNKIVISNINLSKREWDSFETSWDFEEHPFIRWSKGLWDSTSIAASMDYYYGGNPKVSCPLELCFMLWQGECNERFNQLKANEEELNRIFIDIYGLQDELIPDVEDKDVTVRKADLQRDMRSFVSYAVGCMFGRYSLDTEGLAYAGGEWDSEKYKSFIPDEDNCIPITDTAYFEDDIVGRFCEFVKVVYGEDTLEANLEYIAKALGNKGNTSRDIIRNYFLNDFFKDHCKIYQKRPIYWLFDSGKQNGFKALVYMHRWNADTIGNMRVEYLHRIQRTYEKEIEREQDTIDNTTNNRDRAAATKRKEKLQKQLKEAKDYDAKVAHLALSRPDIDLDDGVKVNYEKVQTAQDGKKLQILAKI